MKTIEDYDQEIETYDKEIETYNNQRRELREKGKENWSHDDQMNFTRAGLKVMGRALKKEKAEKARNSIFESARNIKEKLGVAIDPLSIDDDDKHYKSVRNALNTISWVPGSSTAYNVNKGDWKGAGKSFATEVALTYLGGKLLQKAFGPAAGSVDELTTVSRWGRLGLKDGDFVMQGNANWWNWIKSGKWQRGMGNQYAPLKSGQEFVVPKSSILPPSQASTAHPIADQGIIGWYKKTILGQRSYEK